MRSGARRARFAIVLALVLVLVLERWGVLFDQAAFGRSQVRIGTQTARSIEDEDDYETRILLLFAALIARI
jgi:hypothetical protein